MVLKETLENNKRYVGTIITHGYLAVSIKDDNGRGWYAPLYELSDKVKINLTKNIKVSFISNLLFSYGKNNNGIRYQATQVILDGTSILS